MPEFQGQGYATSVAARCVARCVEKALSSHWHCEEENIPSWRVADKIGYEDPRFYSTYHIVF